MKMIMAVNVLQILLYVALGMAVFFVGLYFVVRAAVEHGIEHAVEEIEKKQREAARKRRCRNIKNTLSDRTWSCPKCSYDNPMDEFVCRRCGYEKNVLKPKI